VGWIIEEVHRLIPEDMGGTAVAVLGWSDAGASASHPPRASAF
jgi:hypothetical protein